MGTRMTLTEADVTRLESTGATDFYAVNSEGDLQLRNTDGSCIFLIEERCSVYDSRPEGCRIYPCVLDLETDRVMLHSACPWRNEFAPIAGVGQRLRASVELELNERAARKGG
jgi:Fe-S-cluster containining protein